MGESGHSAGGRARRLGPRFTSRYTIGCGAGWLPGRDNSGLAIHRALTVRNVVALQFNFFISADTHLDYAPGAGRLRHSGGRLPWVEGAVEWATTAPSLFLHGRYCSAIQLAEPSSRRRLTPATRARQDKKVRGRAHLPGQSGGRERGYPAPGSRFAYFNQTETRRAAGAGNEG